MNEPPPETQVGTGQPGPPPAGTTIDTGVVSHRNLLGGGINAFAVELLSESFHTSAVVKAFPHNPVSFIWDGIKITLERVGEPRHPRIREKLGLLPVEAGAALTEAIAAHVDRVSQSVPGEGEGV